MPRHKRTEPKKNRYNDSFPLRLREVMDEQGLTQAALAKMISCDYRSVGSYYRGEAFPPIDRLISISTALSVSTDYLLGLSDTRTICSGKEAVIEYLSIPEKTAENLHSLAVDESTSKPLSILLSCDFVPVLKAMEHLTDLFKFAETAIFENDCTKALLVLSPLEDAVKNLKECISTAIESRMEIPPKAYIEELNKIITAAHKTPADYDRTIAELEAILNYHSGQKTEGSNE